MLESKRRLHSVDTGDGTLGDWDCLETFGKTCSVLNSGPPAVSSTLDSAYEHVRTSNPKLVTLFFNNVINIQLEESRQSDASSMVSMQWKIEWRVLF